MKKYLFIISLIFFTTGCVKELKPWDKNIHAKETMKEGGLNKLEKNFEEHIYFSKEASKAGGSLSSGGCGCN